MPSHIRPPNPTKGKLQEAMLAAAERAKMEDPTMETKFPQPNDLGKEIQMSPRCANS